MPCDVIWQHKLVVIGSGNGFKPVWCQAITQTNAELLSIGPSGQTEEKIYQDTEISCLQYVDHSVQA